MPLQPPLDYTAPELTRKVASGPHTTTDIFSLALLAYHLLSRKPLLQCNNNLQTVRLFSCLKSVVDIVVRAQPVAKSTDGLFCVLFCLLTRIEPLFLVIKLFFKSCVQCVALHLFMDISSHIFIILHIDDIVSLLRLLLFELRFPETHQNEDMFLHVPCTSLETWENGLG